MAYIPFLNNAYFSAKVGIGADSPSSQLAVASTGANPYSATLDSTSNMKGIRNVVTSNTDDMVGIYFATGTTTTGTHWSGITGSRTDNATDWGTQLNFYTHDNSVAGLNLATQKMVIKGDGNVGIGTTSPGAKLEVQGTNTAGDLALSNSSTTVLSGDTLGKLAFRNYDGSINFSPFSGEVASIRAVAAVNFTGTNGANTDLLFYTNSVSPANGSPVSGGSEKMRISSAGAIKFNAYGAGTLVTDASGNITVSSGGGAGGPYLPLAGGTMTGTNGVIFPDDFKLNLGTGSDLQIYHDGNDSYIDEVGTGSLIIKSSTIIEMKGANDEYIARFIENGSVDLYYNNALKFETTGTGVLVAGDIQIDSALLSNQENTDIDTGAEVVAQVSTTDYTAAFFDFVIKKTTNIRSGTVYACHDGTNVEFTETSTNDLGNTSDVTLSVDISGTNMRLLATVTSDDWSVKSLIRAI